jgi:hypothetical protein
VVEREKLLDAFAKDGGYNVASSASDKVSPA